MSADIIHLATHQIELDTKPLGDAAVELTAEICDLTRAVNDREYDFERALAVADVFANLDTTCTEYAKLVRGPTDVPIFDSFIFSIDAGPRAILLGVMVQLYRRARDRKLPRRTIARLDAAMASLSRPMQAALVMSSQRIN